VTADTWQSFCIVGVGGHARTKLIPALLANRQQVVGLVSRQPPQTLPCGPVFATLVEALAALPSYTVFVIATPPALHFQQELSAIEAGRDVIVEKPAFVTEREASEATRRCEEMGTLLIEGFMHRHTILFQRLLDFWQSNRAEVEALDTAFLIPALPPGTFREESAIGSSVLYDIGSYLLSLLRDMELPLDDLRLTHVDSSGAAREAIELTGDLSGIDVSARIGVADDYENWVELRMKDGATARFSPFFYGRPGNRTIEIHRDGVVEQESLADGNAFEAMFRVPRSEWRASQPARLAQMVAVTRRLEALGEQLAEWRRR
jgi:predicted dehydrogenase